MDNIEKALKKLKRMKVNELYNNDSMDEFKSKFDGIWWKVLHEYEIYSEGQVSEDEGHLTSSTAKTTYKWLKESQHLTIDFKDIKF